jgi:hypothetical protein
MEFEKMRCVELRSQRDSTTHAKKLPLARVVLELQSRISKPFRIRRTGVFFLMAFGNL